MTCLIYGLYEEMLNKADKLKYDNDFNNKEEVEALLSKSVIKTISECE